MRATALYFAPYVFSFVISLMSWDGKSASAEDVTPRSIVAARFPAQIEQFKIVPSPELSAAVRMKESFELFLGSSEGLAAPGPEVSDME